MERRNLLRSLGASMALALLPHEALAAWSAVSRGARLEHGLSDAQLALVRAVADTIIPRTDTPSATDVGVHRFVDVIVSEQYTEEQREAFTGGLNAIDTLVARDAGVVFADLAPDARGAAIEALEGATDRSVEPHRTYWRLKSLVIHGYFSSERVMKDVLRSVVMPGRFEGAAPMPLTRAAPGSPRSGAPQLHG
jgi:hypothetical protein